MQTYRDSEMLNLTLVSAQNSADLLGERALAYVASSKAASTRRAYRSDWSLFSTWCVRYSHEALPQHRDSHRLGGM